MKPTLAAKQWVEIYYALDLKAHMVEQDACGRDTRWAADLRRIQQIIGPDGEQMVAP